MLKLLLNIFTIILLINYLNGQQLLLNPGFEQPFDGSDWYCHGNCELTQDTDAHSGVYSGRVRNRNADWHVVSQYVTLSKNANYYFECWIKLLNLSENSLFHEAVLRMEISYNESYAPHTPISIQPKVRPDRGWIKLSGDFYLDDSDIIEIRLYVQVGVPYVEYLVDTSSLTKLIPDPDWKTEANARIENIRKNDVTINMGISEEYDPNLISLEVNLKTHHFAFGSAVREEQMNGTDEDSLKYKQCFFENYQWSVFHNAHKWKQMERIQDQIEYPDGAMQVLLDNGIPIRGHNLFWNKEQNVPDWVVPLYGQELVEQMIKRLDYTLPRYKGYVVHWDVNNEQLHGDFFENRTGDVDFMTNLFKEVRSYDEDVMLFLNDFQLVRLGRYARAMVNSAQLLFSQDAPVSGIGVQSHLTGSITLDEITAMKKRLEVLTSIGLPIWITELDIEAISDPEELADAYDDVITLYFSDPAIEGIILWGFSDIHHGKPEAAMFEGPDYIPNESGMRWQEMIRQRWNTSVSFEPSSSEDTFGFSGFHGSYSYIVKYEDTTILEDSFYLDEEDLVVNIDV